MLAALQSTPADNRQPQPHEAKNQRGTRPCDPCDPKKGCIRQPPSADLDRAAAPRLSAERARLGEVGMQQLFLTYWFVGMIKLLFGV